MARHLTSDDVWPKHPEAHWRPVLNEAHLRGWRLTRFEGAHAHSWGRLRCPGDDSRCGALVDSSADGADSVAQDVYRDILECPHGDALPAVRLGAAERLARIAGLLAEREGIHARIREHHERAHAAHDTRDLFRQLDDAETALAAAQISAADFDVLADAVLTEIVGAEAQEDDGDDPVEAALAGLAEDTVLSTAASRLLAHTKAKDAKPLRGVHDALNEELALLKEAHWQLQERGRAADG